MLFFMSHFFQNVCKCSLVCGMDAHVEKCSLVFPQGERGEAGPPGDAGPQGESVSKTLQEHRLSCRVV